MYINSANTFFNITLVVNYYLRSIGGFCGEVSVNSGLVVVYINTPFCRIARYIGLLAMTLATHGISTAQKKSER